MRPPTRTSVLTWFGRGVGLALEACQITRAQACSAPFQNFHEMMGLAVGDSGHMAPSSPPILHNDVLDMSFFLPGPTSSNPCHEPHAFLSWQTQGHGIQRPPTCRTVLLHDTPRCTRSEAEFRGHARCSVTARQCKRSWQLHSTRAVRPDVSLDDVTSIERATDCPAMLFIGDFSPDEVGIIEESLSDDTSNDGVQCLWMHPRCNAMPLRQLLLSFQPGSSVDVSRFQAPCHALVPD